MAKLAVFLLLVVVSAALASVDFEENDEVLRFEVNDEEVEKKKGVHWAVIVAGSNSWFNYRHQADICHAYHIMKGHGIPEERIITMMYDDIANNEMNPTPGIIINHPNGSDVYAGVKIDYRQEDVTPENFLSVLRGEEEVMKNRGTGKVLKSGPHDHVFVNFADHGAPGLIAFPRGVLHATDLMDAIHDMHQNNMYKQLVFYVEACESGSMFEDILSKNISVYATTAANSHESSYACYMDQKRKTYLGDVYSVKWMEDSDAENLKTETLQKQFEIVKQETNTSHVMEFGDMKISTEPVCDFQGAVKCKQTEPIVVPRAPLNAVPSEKVAINILYHRLAWAESREEELAILDEMRAIVSREKHIDDVVEKIVNMATDDEEQVDRVLTTRRGIKSWECYETAVKDFNRKCFDLSQEEYSLRKLYTLVNLCEEGLSTSTILQAIHDVCLRRPL